jgi:hypothetical protein
LCVLLAAILAGCGGVAGGGSQRVTGDGYRFAAPEAWSVSATARSTAASKGAVDRVEVQTFRLLRPYRAELFASATRELDLVAGKLAVQLGGRVAARASTEVAGRDARAYRIAYGKRVVEITFVLDGRREYELLCRRLASAGTETCDAFVRSFRLD